MTKLLAHAQLDHFNQYGHALPVHVMSEQHASAVRKWLEAYERESGGPLKGALRHKSPLLFVGLNELVRQKRIVDAIEDLYGANILCWTTSFFIKEACDAACVSWHQDSSYWGLSQPDVVTAWVALQVTHLLDQISHKDTFSKNRLLTRGQEVAVHVDPANAVSINLHPGEMSQHHVRIIHGSPPNASDHRRIDFAIRYIPTHMRQIEGEDSATQVRGTNTINTSAHEPRPFKDSDPVFVAMHQAIADRSAKILYQGMGVKSYNESTS